MTYSIILGMIFAVLFALCYVTRRRYGVLVLALLAGQMLSTFWASDLTPIVANLGLNITKPPLRSLVGLAIMLAPVIILLISGPVARRKHERLVGAVIFALSTLVLAMNYINDALVADDLGRTIQENLANYQPIILSVCIILAIFDVLAIHTRQKLTGGDHHEKSKHHH